MSDTLRSPAWRRRMYDRIYKRLKTLARRGETKTYGKFGAMVGLTAQSPFLFKTLVEITTQEHREGRPLLSVLIKRSRPPRHGKRFFELAEELGRYRPGRDPALGERQFFKEERDRVWAYWGSSK